MKIASLCDLYKVNCAAHNFAGHLGTAISAHFLASIPNLRVLEYQVSLCRTLLAGFWFVTDFGRVVTAGAADMGGGYIHLGPNPRGPLTPHPRAIEEPQERLCVLGRTVRWIWRSCASDQAGASKSTRRLWLRILRTGWRRTGRCPSAWAMGPQRGSEASERALSDLCHVNAFRIGKAFSGPRRKRQALRPLLVVHHRFKLDHTRAERSAEVPRRRDHGEGE